MAQCTAKKEPGNPDKDLGSVRESAYDASCENRQNLKQKRNTMVALRGQSTWRVFIIHVFAKAFGDASHETW